MSAAPLLEIEGLAKRYPLRRAHLLGRSAAVWALTGISLRLERGMSLGVVGESGSGKSTLARLIVALERPTAGTVRILGADLAALAPGTLRAHRRYFQMVFQDPYASLDPRFTVGRSVAEPLVALLPAVSGSALDERVALALEAVGLAAGDARRHPHVFSGGQRQRVAIARALVTEPALIVADEPVSALDASVRGQILNLLMDLQERAGLSYVLISHDLAVVRTVCDAVAVLHRGSVVERGPTGEVFAHPAHPYTQALLAAVPRIGAARRARPSREGGAHATLG
ncbi:MAG: ATP-binding cassette domain-containing protein, partial [Alphaproteobacteria bacterium]|nr:ATP-binding cassette domain-containing protein [Alphaproteobacteria bacterium]